MSDIADQTSFEREISDCSTAETVVSYSDHTIISDADQSVITEASSGSHSLVRQGVFPFLKLPPEIRNEIYRIVLVGSRPLYIYCHDSCRKSDVGDYCYCSYEAFFMTEPSSQVRKNLAIFLVNRQFCNEASHIFYDENFFNFDLSRPGPNVNGFHPHLTRIRRCSLWMSEHGFDTYSIRNEPSLDVDGYTTLLVMAFANVLAGGKQLESLVLGIPLTDASMFDPLESLRGIRRVHLLHDWPHMRYQELGLCLSHYLRVFMMSNGEYSSIGDVTRQDMERSEETWASRSGSEKEGKEFTTTDRSHLFLAQPCDFKFWNSIGEWVSALTKAQRNAVPDLHAPIPRLH